MKNSRLAAFEILNEVIRKDAYSNLALDARLNEVDKKDKPFVSQLVLGVVERRLTLDYIISRFLKRRTKPKVKIILYIGVYQLYFMDRVPSSAAVNETVSVCDYVSAEYYKGLVNAVLRNIDKNRISLDTLSDDVKYSVPQNLINMWKKQYGDDTAFAILSCVNEKPPVFAVPNTLFADAQGLALRLVSEGVNCEIYGGIVKVLSGINVKELKAYNDGFFHIEDLSSYECAKSLGAKEGDTVLDICSAPGGKAFTIAEDMNDSGKIYAFDLHEHRVDLIKSGAKRLKLNCIQAEVNDASLYCESIPKADKILCDVPCSGFGVIRRKPEIRYKNLDSIKDLPSIQYNILETSSKYLKSGGRLMYSTCTLNKKENEKVVEKFLNQNNNFKLVKQNTVIPSLNKGDGFYYALLEIEND